MPVIVLIFQLIRKTYVLLSDKSLGLSRGSKTETMIIFLKIGLLMFDILGEKKW